MEIMFAIVSLGPTTMPGTQQMLKKKKKKPQKYIS